MAIDIKMLKELRHDSVWHKAMEEREQKIREEAIRSVLPKKVVAMYFSNNPTESDDDKAIGWNSCVDEGREIAKEKWGIEL